MHRREFLKTAAWLTGGLLLAVRVPELLAADAAVATEFKPNAFVHVGSNDVVTVVVGKSEMGQGVLTSLPMIVADEMDADWTKVRFEQAPADAAFASPGMGMQVTGGSTSVRRSYDQLRSAGAAAREMLVAAAAAQWGVPVGECEACYGRVVHAISGRHASFGSLAERAAQLPVPAQPKVKAHSEAGIVGKPLPRLDVPDKVNGKARFGIDVQLPGMLTAVLARCPVFGGTVKAVDDTAARQVPGVKDVIRLESAVAVLGTTFWAARQGREKLKVTWDPGPHAGLNSHDVWTTYEGLAGRPGQVTASRGDAEKAIAACSPVVEAEYRLPYLAHATMEPMNCTADVTDTHAAVYGGMQAQTLAEMTTARLTGLLPTSIDIHTTFLGGGFGRRAEVDFVAEAVELSKRAHVPVKVMWTREDDMQHDFYRPAALHRVRAGLRNGHVAGWWHRLVTQSIAARYFPMMMKNGIDPTSIEGAVDQPYDVDAFHMELHTPDPGVPVGFWRSVGSSHNAFVVESFVDELAHAAHQDPYRFRRGLLKHSPRHLGVLDLAASKSGWGKPLPKGWGRGIAVAMSFGTYVAQVVDLEARPDAPPRVHRVTIAVDCGPVINPDTVAAQMEGGMCYGLSAVLSGQITLKDGRVEQHNFDDYAVVRMSDMPKHVEVHIVPSTEAMGGCGEPGVPPIAPAVTNAIFAATGKRIRTLPLG